MNLATIHRISHKLHNLKVPILPKLLYIFQYLIYNSIVPPSTVIGTGTLFAYRGIGVVIHKRAIIGSNCIIGQGITIGGRSKHFEVPSIGDNVYLGPGSRILGPIKIGDNVVVGPNSVVIDDVASGSIVVGIPARVIKSGIIMNDYI